MIITTLFTFFILTSSQAKEPCNDVVTCPPEPLFLEENTKGNPSPMSKEKRERWKREEAEKPKFSEGSEIVEKAIENPSGIPRDPNLKNGNMGAISGN